MTSHYIYDIETYPNLFCLGAIHAESGTRYLFEISSRVDQSNELLTWLRYLRSDGSFMVGFNNIGFDYPVLHYGLLGRMTYRLLKQKADAIINSGWDQRFNHIVWPNDMYVPQIDLFKIHHFDNKARQTSLKALEYAMRMDSIEDLPYDPTLAVTHQQMQEIIDYMWHDIEATQMFYDYSKDAIAFRRQLSEKYGHDFINDNDTKIGKQYFIMQLEAAGIQCFTRENRQKKPRQSPRPQGIRVADILLPLVSFTHPEFRRVHDWFRSHTVMNTKEDLNLHATVNGFTFDFGLGGIHGSVESQLVESDDHMTIIDVDVTSYYPSVAISHRIYPEHLTEVFCDIYGGIRDERLKYPKGTAENAVMKLANNGTYGETNNQYSCFLDPQYTMAVTINGQLMLCMLAESAMSAIPGLQMIQANTDGITVKLPRESVPIFNAVCKMWEITTKLDLEHVEYSRMWIRDVNNYIAEYAENGKLKCKGAYVGDIGPNAKDPAWHKDHSALVVPKVAVKYLQDGGSIEELIRSHPDRMDFMLRAKVRRSDKLMWGDDEIQRISRFYVCSDEFGRYLSKVNPLTDNQRQQTEVSILKLTEEVASMPPEKHHLKKYSNAVVDIEKKQRELATNGRQIAICGGWTVQVCNNIKDATVPINFDYYVKEVQALVAPFVKGEVL